ncbi:MAG: hypothetical protein GWO20_00320 [Candidatus Korarchaeota archaeon]|nr:hypothetical protein [Candidatus Korarchaeota archaeon]
MEGRIEEVRRLPAGAFSDSLETLLTSKITVDEASDLIEEMRQLSNYNMRRKLLEEELEISWEETKKAYQLYKEACCEGVREVIFFLAEMSSTGPRGARAELVSAPNIRRCLGFFLNKGSLLSCYREIGGEYLKGLLLNLGLTASDPSKVGAEFSLNDLKRGVYIPKIEEEAYAVGLAHAFAYMSVYPSNSALTFTGRKREEIFFHHVRSVMEKTYNIPGKVEMIECPPSKAIIRGKVRTFDRYKRPRIQYKSRVLCDHFAENHSFPTCLEEIMESRIPRHYRESESFLKGVITKALVVNSPGGGPRLRYQQKSRKFLEDLQELMSNCRIDPSFSIQNQGGKTFSLCINVTPTRQLFERGIIDRPDLLEEYHKESHPH